ncbi:hypothetical protein RAN53_12320 [Halomonas sp. SSL-5]|uniref:hypothetical protein n=1 Tax=Halomonas sp. SSL-5 TaxID=3065855 RepID=UPI00273A137A|nr:hypothetical protein [Halomonas sp. SSL-5]MDY7117131.1 hypothetical protein [Halomonas sp. SSL-5]
MTTRKRNTKATEAKPAEAKAAEPTPNPQAAPAQGEATPNTDAATAKDGPTQDAQQDTPPAAGKEATGTKDGATEPKAGKGEIPALFVRTKRRFKSRRRAGHRFDRNRHGIALEALSAEEIAALKADPALEVQECTFPAEPDEPETT